MYCVTLCRGSDAERTSGKGRRRQLWRNFYRVGAAAVIDYSSPIELRPELAPSVHGRRTPAMWRIPEGLSQTSCVRSLWAGLPSPGLGRIPDRRAALRCKSRTAFLTNRLARTPQASVSSLRFAHIGRALPRGVDAIRREDFNFRSRICERPSRCAADQRILSGRFPPDSAASSCFPFHTRSRGADAPGCRRSACCSSALAPCSGFRRLSWSACWAAACRRSANGRAVDRRSWREPDRSRQQSAHGVFGIAPPRLRPCLSTPFVLGRNRNLGVRDNRLLLRTKAPPGAPLHTALGGASEIRLRRNPTPSAPPESRHALRC
jgi:hypothetical protein